MSSYKESRHKSYTDHYNLRPRYSYDEQPTSDQEFKRLIRKAGYNHRMSKYRISEKIKNEFLLNQGINPTHIFQGFAFEGINGELADLNSNYAIAIETLGLINYIPTINKVKSVNGHIGYDMDGKPITLRETFKWLDIYHNKYN